MLHGLVLTLAACAASGWDGPIRGDEATTRPPIDDGPVTVEVAVQILDFARVSSRDESFDVTAFVETRWVDPRLARSEGGSGRRRRLRPSQIWTPRLFFPNALEAPKEHGDPEAEVTDDGHVSFGRILSGKFSADLDLRSFPFDRQRLPMRIGSYYDRREIRLTFRPEEVTLADKAFLTDWDILGVVATPTEATYDLGNEPYNEILVVSRVARRPTFFVYRVLIPMTLLVMVSWLAFWFEPVGLQPQISTCMAVLISLAAFNFGMDFAMPKQNYLTFIDCHALLGFAIVAASSAVVAAVHRLVIAGKVPAALRIQRLARWSLPALYALAVGVEVATMLTTRPNS